MTIIEKVKREIILSPSSLLLGLMLLFAACDDVRLHTFHALQGEWLPTDTLEYVYVNASSDALHEMEVQLRCSSAYPVRELWLRVECLSCEAHSVDTLCCEIYDSLGRQQGSGAGMLRQTSHKVGLRELQPSDTTHIKVTHLMDSAIEGVCDVGIRVCGRGRHQSSGN